MKKNKKVIKPKSKKVVDDTNKQEEVKKNYKLPRPYLLKRVFSTLIDFLFIVAIFAGLEATMYYTIFEPLGYFSMVDKVHELYDDSHLYVYSDENKYQTITEIYDSNKTADENYDRPITEYYTYDERAISDNKLAEYKATKLANKTLFTSDALGNPIRISGSDESLAKEFYKNCYDAAIDYFEDNPEYYYNAKNSFYIIVGTVLFSTILSTGIIYLLIPLLRKDGETPSQIILHIALCDGRDDTKVKKKQVIIRYVVLLIWDFVIPILFYSTLNYFTLIPVLITLAMVCFTKSNSGPHDYVSKTYVVDKKDLDIPIINVIEETKILPKDEDEYKNPYL
jgi:RDD family.